MNSIDQLLSNNARIMYSRKIGKHYRRGIKRKGNYKMKGIWDRKWVKAQMLMKNRKKGALLEYWMRLYHIG
jgi:hypothetical protein